MLAERLARTNQKHQQLEQKYLNLKTNVHQKKQTSKN